MVVVKLGCLPQRTQIGDVGFDDSDDVTIGTRHCVSNSTQRVRAFVFTEAALQHAQQDDIEQAASQCGAPSDGGDEKQSLAGCWHRGHGRSALRQFGRCNPGDLNQSLMCEAVSACRARRKSSSRAIVPSGACSAASRKRLASSANRCSNVPTNLGN